MARFGKNGAGRGLLSLLAVFGLMLATGCLYRGDTGEQSISSIVQSLPAVEQAVAAYRSTHGSLPAIEGKTDDSAYGKYRVDFKVLRDGGFLAEIPSGAFERGGYFHYVIVDRKDGPQVKLLDLRVAQAAGDLQRLVDGYSAREGKLPFGEPVAPGFYAVDYGLLGVSLKQAKSVYEPHFLPYILHESGRVGIHYALDLMRLIQANGLSPDNETDLRSLLVERTPFVPVASFPYRWMNGEPVPVAE